MSWAALSNMFVNNLMGSYVLTTIFFYVGICITLAFIRAPLQIYTGVLSLFLFYMVGEGILKGWIFFIALAVMGASIASGVLKLFFSNS
jgi:hypothetical protein